MKTALYIHWPFCAAKCPYCDFNSYVSDTIDHDIWTQSYLDSLAYYAQLLPDRVISSVFFGGGTPSLMNPKTAELILDTMQRHWRTVNDLEITLEANPTSVENQKLKDFRAAGINRVSLGVQALNDADLKFLGREHSAVEAMQAIDIARNNFDRYSFDLMYARPEQTLQDWQAELLRAIPLAGGHMSLYQLTIERSTPFYMDHAQGKFTMPDDGVSADFYTLTQDIMGEADMPAYEVSNHAAPHQESLHNMTYWNYDDYIGIGPGAHGRLTINGVKHATREHRAPQIWLDRVKDHGYGAHPFEAITAKSQFTEALMVGLRLSSGVFMSELAERTGCPWEQSVDTDKVTEIVSNKWGVFDGDRLVLNAEGFLRLNMIVPFIQK